jgi:hypothetical protein
LHPFLLYRIHGTYLTHLILLDIIRATYRNDSKEYETAFYGIASCLL